MAAAPVTATKPEGAESIEAMRQMLRNGGVKVVSAPQLFPTPMELANRMVEVAAPGMGDSVLEPSAGSGNLLRALAGVVPFITMKQTACDVVAVELNADLCESLKNAGLAQWVVRGDFLECTPQALGRFDVILMNPPFANGSDIKHIEHARQFLAPGGRLVAICADGPRQRERLVELGEYESLPAGSFANAGTQVNTAMVVIRAASIHQAKAG
jgi:predicted RNA methylase